MADESKTLTSLAELGEVALPDVEIEPEPQIDRLGRTYATGKRKDAVARVWLRPGVGTITVNKRAVEGLLRPPGAQNDHQPASGAGRAPLPVRRHLHRQGRRPLRPGRRGSARHQPGAGGARAGAPQDAQVRRLPHPATAASWSARSTASARPAGASSSRSANQGVAGAAALMCFPAPAPAITADPQ